MTSKVLFIIHDVYQDDNEFPLGIGYLTSSLRNAGVEVDICCQDIYHYTNEEMAKKFLIGKKYDIIGTGFMSARFVETIVPLCKTINKYKKDALLVLGGYGASALPEYTLLKTRADVVVIGEGEGTVVELCSNEDLSKIKGIAYREGNNVIVNERRPLVRDLDTIPFPAWDLFPMDVYTSSMEYPTMKPNEKAFQIATSRGCVNKCSFCYRMERGIRFRSIKKVVEEIRCLYDKYGVTYFNIQDELFITTIKRLNEFVDELDRNNLDIKYDCNVRANTISEDIIKVMKESNCSYINVGFESVTQQCLDELNKNTKVADNYLAARLIKKYDIPIGLNMIWGTPSDNGKTIKDSVNFIKKFNTYYVLRTIRPITPYPGCPMYYDAIAKGLLAGPDDFFARFKNSDLVTVNFTKLDVSEMHKLLFEANKELILDHYMNTTKNMQLANENIGNFYNLYFKNFTKFRGARKYKKGVEK